MQVVHLLSGGLDSVVMLHHLVHNGHEVTCLMFCIGQENIKELHYARMHSKQCGVEAVWMELPPIKPQGVVVPMRNAIFLSHAVAMATTLGYGHVSFAANKNDARDFLDCTMSFISSFNQMVNRCGYEVKVIAPFINFTKRQIIELGNRLNVNLDKTWTCYTNQKHPCGVCLACKVRMEAECST